MTAVLAPHPRRGNPRQPPTRTRRRFHANATSPDEHSGKLTKMVVEGALEGEMDDHLGYPRHDPEGRNSGNSRNGHRSKTVLTEAGPVEISVPRDRESTFEPQIVAKRQRRLTGVDDMVISLSAKGLTHGEIAAHLEEVYGTEASKQTITNITERVTEKLADWQSRPLDPGLRGGVHRRDPGENSRRSSRQPAEWLACAIAADPSIAGTG